MTEFQLSSGCVLGLMPEASIRRMLDKALPEGFGESKAPRSEVYLRVPDAELYWKRSLELGGIELSPMLLRDWGHRVAYSLDPDGHVLAFAELEKI
jgi:uncharacterized protein